MSIFNNNRWMTMVVLLLLAANITTLVLLWNRGGNDKVAERPVPAQGGGGPFEYLSRELKLDDQQKEAYAKLRDEHRSRADILEQDIRKAKDDYFGLLKTPGVSDSTLKPYLDRITAKEGELDLYTFHHFQDVRKLCNPQQQQRFDEIIQEALHNMRPGRRGPPPPGAGGPPNGPNGMHPQGPPPPQP